MKTTLYCLLTLVGLLGSLSGQVVINEVVVDPQQDWNDSSGGDGSPFNAVPGLSTVSDTDEWVELYNAGGASVDLTGWVLEMNDATPASETLGSGSSTLVFSNGGSLSNFLAGEYLVIGNPAGAMNDSVYLVLRNSVGAVVDDVEIGDDPELDGSGDGAPDGGTSDGNANSTSDEAVGRLPNGSDTDDDVVDFAKGAVSIGATNDGVLPVQLTSFAATATGRRVTLTWETSLETGNLGFEIQRRSVRPDRTPASSWEVVGFVAGSGTSSSKRQYTFDDVSVDPGRYAYCIKQIDLDGTLFTAAEAEVVVGAAGRNFTLGQNFPNPFNPATTIEFTLEEDDHVVMKLYDSVGREIATLLDEHREAGLYQQVRFDASRYSSGIYFYALQANGRVEMKKMILVK